MSSPSDLGTTATTSPLTGESSTAIGIRGVSKAFGNTQALHEVSFDVPRAAVHALCGGNGSGKSTLIKILAGVEQADSGSIVVGGESHPASRTNPAWSAAHHLHFVHQAVGTFPGMTVAENFAIGSGFGSRGLAPVPWRHLHRRVGEALERFGVDVSPRAVMSEISPAMQTMVAVARALQGQSELGRGVLVLDEPTAALPTEEVDALLDAIRSYAAQGYGVVLVSHRLTELLAVADGVTFLRDGLHVETRSAHGLTERTLIERITGGALDGPLTENRVTPTDVRTRVSVRGLKAGPLDDVTMDVRVGEVVGIAGLLGSGRSALLQSLFGARPVEGGTAELDGVPLKVSDVHSAMREGVAYVPEDRAGQAAFADLAVRMNLSAPSLRRYWNRLWMDRAAERDDASSVIERYGIKVGGPEAGFATMSGGNQQKVVMARWLELAPRLLLLDEPTQGVDVGARAAIHALVRRAAAEGTAVLVVSSDPHELVDLCDRVVGLHAGRIVGEVSGDGLTAQACSELAHGFAPPDEEQPQRTSAPTTSERGQS